MTYPPAEHSGGGPASPQSHVTPGWGGSAISPPVGPPPGQSSLTPPYGGTYGQSYGPEFAPPHASEPHPTQTFPAQVPPSPPPGSQPTPPPVSTPTIQKAPGRRRGLYVLVAGLVVLALIAGAGVIGLPMLGSRRPSALRDIYPSPLTRPELTVTQRGTMVSVRATADGNGTPATLTVRGCGLPEELMASGSGALAVETRAEVQLAYSLTCTITAALVSGPTFPARAGAQAEQTITTTELPLLSPPIITATVVNGNRIQVSATGNGNGESATLTVTGCGQSWTTQGVGMLIVMQEFLAGYNKTCSFKAVLTSGPTNPQRSDPAEVTTPEVNTSAPPPTHLWSRSDKPVPGRAGVYYANLTLKGYAPNSNVTCTLNLSDGVFSTTIRVNAQGDWGPSIPYGSRGDTLLLRSEDPNFGGAFGECVQN